MNLAKPGIDTQSFVGRYGNLLVFSNYQHLQESLVEFRGIFLLNSQFYSYFQNTICSYSTLIYKINSLLQAHLPLLQILSV